MTGYMYINCVVAYTKLGMQPSSTRCIMSHRNARQIMSHRIARQIMSHRIARQITASNFRALQVQPAQL